MKIKNKEALEKMRTAGVLLAEIFEKMKAMVVAEVTTASIDVWIAQELKSKQLVSQTMGYHGYAHVSCISVNDAVVHGVPSELIVLKPGDLVKVDVCASWQGYCADMARCFVVAGAPENEIVQNLIRVAYESLDYGIAQAVVSNRLFDISASIQHHIESNGFGVVRDFAGHGIGSRMHEAPDVPNFGYAGTGMRLCAGMTFAIEPMLTQGNFAVYVDTDGWTVRTRDASLASHVEDTIVITEHGPEILTRLV